ncbi:hypothetical protein E3E22_10480 [Thermococcus sp. MV5]|uniref:hypothetical protein n=1 Tax=Thermococcus sp. MV5 TaxID=1638272 RepID=UPI00143993A1|nr:hypothetical protein [Thermococcus sp. MV5]NJE27026.1 hypothetical protein [Thermococcus sp. MV5]
MKIRENVKDRELIFTRVIVGDGKITIPKFLRELLRLQPGDEVTLQILEVNRITRHRNLED